MGPLPSSCTQIGKTLHCKPEYKPELIKISLALWYPMHMLSHFCLFNDLERQDWAILRIRKLKLREVKEFGSQPTSLKSAWTPKSICLTTTSWHMWVWIVFFKNGLLKKLLHSQPRNRISFSPYTPRHALHLVHLHFGKIILNDKLSQSVCVWDLC